MELPQYFINTLKTWTVSFECLKGREFNREEPGDPPSHPALLVVANCEQVLSSHTSRRLVVMERRARLAEGEENGGAAAEAEGVFETSAEFRNHFFASAAEVPRRERKERVKRYGHLNLAGDRIREDG